MTMPDPGMRATVATLLAPGKGLLAADESFPTLEKRFAALNLSSTAETRGAYRELLFTTPGLSEFISGVILFDETLRQRTATGVPMAEWLAHHGLVPGIKVDKGTIAMANFAGEKTTQGLDGLRDRLAEYRTLGARFTKWRAVIAIGEGLPTRTCLAANARALAMFAARSQEVGLVPIVEPEILMEGAHSLARCEEVTRATLESLFTALSEHRVELEATILKTSMVLSGSACPQRATVAEVAVATIRSLRRSVPAAVGGIMFLSGGQPDAAATERLQAICRVGEVPWPLSFSFGRALQDAAMKTWAGSPANVAAAQAALLDRARSNALALQGQPVRKAAPVPSTR
jgi:fructose-bisphosphate aldolase class I